MTFLAALGLPLMVTGLLFYAASLTKMMRAPTRLSGYWAIAALSGGAILCGGMGLVMVS